MYKVIMGIHKDGRKLKQACWAVPANGSADQRIVMLIKKCDAAVG